MDRLAEICLEEIALEGLDGITLETFWMRLRTRDPPFPLVLDDASKPAIWQQVAQSDELEFFELPEPREMPILRDLLEGTNPLTGAVTATNEKKYIKEVYPFVYVEDKEKGVRGSCPTYYERIDVTKEVRNEDGSVKMSVFEVDERWGAKLVMVASQDLRWSNMLGLHGDPEAVLRDKQYMMLECICRGRTLGEWQWNLAKLLKSDGKNMFYQRKSLQKAGFIKKRMCVYQVNDRPHSRAVIMFGSSFKERVAMPMYYTLWQAMSDMLKKRPNRTWSQPALRTALREQFPDMEITDKNFKRVLGGAVTGKMVKKMRLPHEQVFNERKPTKTHPDTDMMVVAVQLLKTYEEYINEDNIDDEDDDDEKSESSVLGDPQGNTTIAERNLRAQILSTIADQQESGQPIPLRSIKNSLMIDFYMARYNIRRLVDGKMITRVMMDEGRQRTSGYCLTNSVERVQEILKNKQTPSAMGSLQETDDTNAAGSSSTPTGSRTGYVTTYFPDGSSTSSGSPAIKQEVGEDCEAIVPNIDFGVTGSATKTSNYLRRRKFMLDFMKSNKVAENIYPITKALRIEEKKIGSTVTCDNKTVRRLVSKLCEENLLQTISTVVMSDDGLHSKTVNLITEYGIKPIDHVVTSALQVAKFRFFGSLSTPRKQHKKPTPTLENIGVPKEKSSSTKPKKDSKHSKKKHGDKEKKSKKHKHKDKDKEGDKDKEEDKEKEKEEDNEKEEDKDKEDVVVLSETVASPTETPQTPDYPQDPLFGTATRRYHYHKQLGYLPKMLRMRAAHIFIWYMVHGHSRQILKQETLEDVEKMRVLEDEDSDDVGLGDGGMEMSKSDARHGKDREHRSKKKKHKKKTHKSSVGNLVESPVETIGEVNQELVDEGVNLPAIPISIRKVGDELLGHGGVSLDGACSTVSNVIAEANGATEAVLDTTAAATTENTNGADCVLGVNDVLQDSNMPQTADGQSISVPHETGQSQKTPVEGDQSGTEAVRTDQSDRTPSQTDQSQPSTIQTCQSKPSGSTSPVDNSDEDVIFEPQGSPLQNLILCSQTEFTVYCDTHDWRRYVPPLPLDQKRCHGWFVIRDLLLSMPLSIFVKVVSLPIEIIGIKEYMDHPVKQHILMKQLPVWIRKQLLRGRRYLFQLENVMIKLASIGLVVLSNGDNFEKDQLSVYVCKKASILDTTTSKPDVKKISDQQRYLRRFYDLNQAKDVEDYWFDLQCICLDTPLGFSKERGLTKKKVVEHRHEIYIKSIARQMTDTTQPVTDDGIPPGDGRGAGGLDSSFFSHLRRNWNWYSVVPDMSYDRYTANQKEEGQSGKDIDQEGKPKVKRLGSIQYRRSNMSKGTTIEVVSINKHDRKSMLQATLKRKRPADDTKENSSPPAKTKKQAIKEKNKGVKNDMKEAKKKDAEIQKEKNERRKFRKPKTRDGIRNTTTYDDVDEEARNQMSKMRVDWTPEEDSLILLCRVASSILNTKAIKLGAFVPWFVIRDVLHNNIERSKDKTTKSVAKRSHHIHKNKYTFLNFKICLAEAQADKELMDEFKKKEGDYSVIKVCAKEYERLVARLQQKFQTSECTLGALKDLRELNNYYIVTPVHQHVSLDDNTLVERDVKSIEDIHFKLLHSLVLSSLVSRESDLYNNQILYKTYEQYDQTVLGDVFINLKKLGFCNRNRKHDTIRTTKRVLPMAPISLQPSHSYKERFVTPIPETVCDEIQGFVERLQTSDEVMVLPTEVDGGDCTCFLSLVTLNMIKFDITLPDQIIVLDSNLIVGEPNANDSDSDSDSDTEGGGESVARTKKPKEDHEDIQELMRIQEERNKIVAETEQNRETAQESTRADKELPDEGTDSGVATLSGLVSAEHSYSLSQRTLPSNSASQKQDGLDAGNASQTHTEQDSSANNDKSAAIQESTGTSENNPPTVGYNISAGYISHARWLILQGNFAPGACGGSWVNIQDNTVVNACTVTLRKGGRSRLGTLLDSAKRTESGDGTASTQDRTRSESTLLWDFENEDHEKFAGFMPSREKPSQIFGREDTLTSKWSDVGAMIEGLNLSWPKEDLQALRTMYNSIEEADTMGIRGSDFRRTFKATLQKGTTKTMSDYLQILVQEQLVLEAGFDVLRLVATKNASAWLTHSTRLNRQTDSMEFPAQTPVPNKRQRTEPALIDITTDKDDECVIISDEEDNEQESSQEKGEMQKRRRGKKTEQRGSLDDFADIDVEATTSGKRKRSSSPTEGQGTPVVFIDRPWKSIEGYQSDRELSKYLQNVLLVINSKPGIKEHSVFEFFQDIFHPVECLELLKMLSDLGCITRHAVYKLKPTTIFKPPRQQDTAKPVYYYQPTVDSLVKLACHCKAHVQ